MTGGLAKYSSRIKDKKGTCGEQGQNLQIVAGPQPQKFRNNDMAIIAPRQNMTSFVET